MAAEAERNLECSLPVPSVQELATQHPEIVPSRYIRDNVDDTIATVNRSFDDQILRAPLIDMAKLVNPDSQQQELQNLHSACKNWGLFQLINHGISDELLRNIKEQVGQFFDLPLEEKKRWAQKPGSLEGYGQAFVISEEQKLDWNDMIFLRTLPTQIRKLNLWPEQPPKFRETLETYSEGIREVAASLVRFMGMALEIEACQEIYNAFREGMYEVRMTVYPPCPEPERVTGITQHADYSGITLLLECGNTPGLQVLKDGKWVTVVPIDDAIVANIGHIMEISSNGIYKAPDHRAVVNRLKERQSITTFCFPDASMNIGPAKELTKSGNAPVYKTLTYAEYRHRFYNRRLDVSFIDMLKM
ncbi:2-oxoglutarate (2OG) and Fe(II)-dependent oxygenase superfamily protein [Melia azedarach]|uniref:2-oxoglutarate (2OG) and Fe(II)-dependent oxygenase superfamily protein n=1 Tax=Melia azedarach TaxID=155640 RepID=A0ACC1XJI6_MELAZ|nr:2-oxoglutarate (2OG) and Fe(II)-dependent oxygenase superfamily protein [Melia azedarach]